MNSTRYRLHAHAATVTRPVFVLDVKLCLNGVNTSLRVFIRINGGMSSTVRPLFVPDVRLGRTVDDVRTWSGVVSLKGV